MFLPKNTKIFSEGCPSFIDWMELGFSIVRGWELHGVPPPFLLVICWAKMPLAFGAIREGDIRLCSEGKVTRISLSSDLYWLVSESILVSVQTYIGR